MSNVEVESFKLLQNLNLCASFPSCLAYSAETLLSNGRFHFKELYKKKWSSKINAIITNPNKEFIFYHVCQQEQEARILEHGIFHDESPTLTSSLFCALNHALCYHSSGIKTSILEVKTLSSLLEFCFIDHLGPGFLPIAKKRCDEISSDALPENLISHIFEISNLKYARWLNPIYINDVIYRSSDEHLENILLQIGKFIS